MNVSRGTGLEPGNQVAKGRGLGPQLFAAGGHLLAASGGLLRHLRNPLNRLSHLRGVGRLLDGRRGDPGCSQR